MEQEIKYYTPSLEDLRVGYECELYASRSFPPTEPWQPETITPLLLEAMLRMPSSVNEKTIRTPFLTREQIEKEGWRHAWYEKGIHSFEKGDIILTTFDDLTRIKINYASGYQLYDGQCPSINELRYITRMLP